MGLTLDYLTIMYTQLANNYRTPDGKHIESCSLIAIELARRLLAEGKLPHIILVSDPSKTLEPLCYSGKVSWGGHQVCCCDGMAYDPILPNPVSVAHHSKLVFGEDISTTVLVPEDKIRDFVER